MKKSVILALSVPAAIAIIANIPLDNHSSRFHSDDELSFFQQHQILPNGEGLSAHPDALLLIDSNILFPTAKTCGGCHGRDPNNHALVTTAGVDVNIYDDWRSTMMANSAKDPFWRAKVRHEILVNPSHSIKLQDKCTSCHAPAGHYQAKLHDHKEYYTLSDLYADTLGQDGVTCQACHAQGEDFLGLLHSGELYFDTNHIRVAYGPYKMAFAPPMHEFVGITPMFGPQISDAGVCAGCHTLITNTADLNGAPTGNTFIEQATYHEWLNSRYDKTEDNITCQACHVPQIMDEVIISANYQFLTPKFPFGVHELAGANVTMLQLLKNNLSKLGINALPEHFDSTIAATKRMLQEKTLSMNLEPTDLNGDTVRFKLSMNNLAGHKFPSGYPSRRAWVEFIVKKQTGETIFHSGRMNPDYSLPDEDPNFEPHYQQISSPGQVQIYEMVPGDVNGLFTSVLERGDRALKDNRFTPQGFTLTDPAYDTSMIVGGALSDPDFNRNPDGTHGSGSDVLYFAIPTLGYSGTLSVQARIWYQSLPPKWMAPMFEYSAPEIDSFKLMFDAADRSPILISEKTLENLQVEAVSTHNLMDNLVQVYPTLNRDGRLYIRSSPDVQVRRVMVWNAAGKLVWEKKTGEPVQLPTSKGIYIVRVETNRGVLTEKVVRE